MAQYTDEQISDYARQLGEKGASPQEIEAFVSSAVKDRASAAQPVKTDSAPVRRPLTPSAIFRSAMMPPVMNFAGAGVNDIAATAPFVKQMAGVGADAGMEAGGATTGQALGAMTGPAAPIAVPVIGGLGGLLGAFAGNKRRGEPMTAGRAASAFIGGMVPGSPIAGAGLRKTATEAGKFAAQNMAATTAESLIDKGEMPQLGQGVASGVIGAVAAPISKVFDAGDRTALLTSAMKKNAPRDAVLAAAKREGYVFSPTEIDRKAPGFINSTVESVGGKAAIAQDLTHRNQEVTDNLARRALGIGPDVPLQRESFAALPNGTTSRTPSTPEMVREKYETPYRELSGISEQAKRDLQTLETKNRLTAQNEHELNILNSDPKVVRERADLVLKSAADVRDLKIYREEAKKKFQLADEHGGDTKLMEEARAAWAKAEEIEDAIQQVADKLGRPELATQLKEARRMMAKSHALDAALRQDGTVSAPTLGRMLDAGVPLTDELALIAKVERHWGRNMRETGRTPSGASNQARAIASLLGGTGGMAAGQPAIGAAAAVAPWLIPPAARAAAGSRAYQAAFVRPQYPVAMPEGTARFARMATMDASRDQLRPNSFLQFLQREFPNRQPAPYR